MKIIICYQNQFGGTDLLLKRLEKWCINNNIEVYGTDKSLDCLKHETVDLVILPMGSLFDLFELKLKKIRYNKILIWVMGACYISSYLNKDKLKSEKIWIKILHLFLLSRAKKSMSYFYKLNSIVFTDNSSALIDLDYIINSRYINFDELVFPVAIDECKHIFYTDDNSLATMKKVKICWLGRVSKDFKFYALLKVIKDFENKVNSGYTCKTFEFNIIGEGDGLDELIDYLEKSVFQYNIIRHINYNEIPYILKENADILFAMGTSAIDGAKIGCPTIIVKPMMEENQYLDIYTWFFDIKGYSLGDFGASFQGQRNQSFDEIFKEIFSIGNLSTKCKDFSNNFFSDNIFKRLLSEERVSKINKINFVGWIILIEAFILKKIRKWLN
jgi:hypothetical protein